MPRIVTFTLNPSVDVSLRVPRFIPERKLRSSQPRREPGGGGINVTRALKRLGKDSHALSTCGGETGTLLSNLLQHERIHFMPLHITGSTREDYHITETLSGNQFRITLPGPELIDIDVTTSLQTVSNYIKTDDFLILSGSTPPGAPDDFFASLIGMVKNRNVTCIVDTSGTPLRKAADAGVFLLKPNMHELSDLYGNKIEDEKDQLSAARELITRGNCQVVVLSLGSAGALLVTEDFHERLRAPAVPIVSRIGAGDSMVAGIVYGLSEGFGIKKSVQYGIAAGAAAVMTEGTELCKKEDTERLFQLLRDE